MFLARLRHVVGRAQKCMEQRVSEYIVLLAVLQSQSSQSHFRLVELAQDFFNRMVLLNTRQAKI